MSRKVTIRKFKCCAFETEDVTEPPFRRPCDLMTSLCLEGGPEGGLVEDSPLTPHPLISHPVDELKGERETARGLAQNFHVVHIVAHVLQSKVRFRKLGEQLGCASHGLSRCYHYSPRTDTNLH